MPYRFTRSITAERHDEIANELEGKQQVLNDRLAQVARNHSVVTERGSPEAYQAEQITELLLDLKYYCAST